ncbi:MAG: peptide chain release factor 1 [Deltaproteobacteria bacterium]|nr:peptide chain release factor 1 [Deltaproteobacteria bacterium]
MLPKDKLEALCQRYDELETLLCEPSVLQDRNRYVAVSKERGELSPVVNAYRNYVDTQRRISEDKEAIHDPELREMVLEELPELESKLEQFEKQISTLLLPSDPNDARNTLLEIRGGTGGEEAALFVTDLLRMYTRLAERRRWKVEVLSSSRADAGGLKEIILLVSGERVYSELRFEGGVHRVQRVPLTEAQGRVHTSTSTVAVLPEADEVDVQLNESDLQITIAASGGPGGQGVNTTNSAVQILHKPSGIIVKCQDERSQIKNKARALKVLRARLLEQEQRAQKEQEAQERRGMVGTGERAEKIRTYNFPQNRVTDHRIGLTLYKLDAVMNGDLDEILTALRNDYQASLLQQQ